MILSRYTPLLSDRPLFTIAAELYMIAQIFHRQEKKKGVNMHIRGIFFSEVSFL